MRFSGSFLVCGAIGVAVTAAALAQQNVDTVITHGKIMTVDADFRVVEALAIAGGRIVARGASGEVARYAGPGTKVIDVGGAAVIPGLIDNHFHFTRAIETWHNQVRFEGVDWRRDCEPIPRQAIRNPQAPTSPEPNA